MFVSGKPPASRTVMVRNTVEVMEQLERGEPEQRGEVRRVAGGEAKRVR
jgi:hypothetical protein